MLISAALTQKKEIFASAPTLAHSQPQGARLRMDARAAQSTCHAGCRCVARSSAVQASSSVQQTMYRMQGYTNDNDNKGLNEGLKE